MCLYTFVLIVVCLIYNITWNVYKLPDEKWIGKILWNSMITNPVLVEKVVWYFCSFDMLIIVPNLSPFIFISLFVLFSFFSFSFLLILLSSPLSLIFFHFYTSFRCYPFLWHPIFIILIFFLVHDRSCGFFTYTSLFLFVFFQVSTIVLSIFLFYYFQRLSWILFFFFILIFIFLNSLFWFHYAYYAVSYFSFSTTLIFLAASFHSFFFCSSISHILLYYMSKWLLSIDRYFFLLFCSLFLQIISFLPLTTLSVPISFASNFL